MKRFGQLLFAILLIFGMISFIGCANSTNPHNSTTGNLEKNGSSESGTSITENQGSLPPLSLAYLNKLNYEAVMIADHKGFFKDASPNIELFVVSGSGQQTVEALLAGSVDVAATGQGPAADALSKHENVIVLFGTNACADTQIVVAGPHLNDDKAIVPYDKTSDNKSEVAGSFQTASKVLGRPLKLGVQQESTSESIIKKWLMQMGVEFSDFGVDGHEPVSLIDVKANTLPTIMATGGEIDLMAGSQPFPDTTLDTVDGSYRVGSNADIDAYDAHLFITTQEIYNQKEDSIKELAMALTKATDFMESEPEESMQIVADVTGANLETVEAAFKTAEWKTTVSDEMIDSIFDAAESKGYDLTREHLKEKCIMTEWFQNQ